MNSAPRKDKRRHNPSCVLRETFKRSSLDWEKVNKGSHEVMLALHKELIGLRRRIPSLRLLSKENLKTEIAGESKIVTMQRGDSDSRVFCVMNFESMDMSLKNSGIEGNWEKILDTSESIWLGPGAFAPKQISAPDEIRLRPYNFVMYQSIGGFE